MRNKLIISKDGKDAINDTNPDHLKVSSEFNTLKYFMSGNINLSINGNGTRQYTQKIITHNLGYTPFFVCFLNGYFTAPRIENTISPNTTLYASAYADSNNLYLTLLADWSSPRIASVIYVYKIFKNNLGF